MVHSLITLYSSGEMDFETNGLGSLGEAVSCTVTEEANGSFELELVYPVFGRHYKEIENRCIILVKPNPVDRPQPFRIYEISRPINGLVTFYAAHISYDLSGYPIGPFSAGSAVGAMAGLKTNAVKPHPFTFWTDKNVTSTFNMSTPISTRAALGGIQGSILDLYGGEYKFDRFLVRLYTHRGYDRGVVIRYGKNLTDLEQEENCSSVYTGVLPYWYSNTEDEEILVQLPEKIVPTDGSYNFVNILTLDLSSDFQEKPTSSELRKRAQKYIKDNNVGVPKVSLTISFAQLEQTEEYKHLTLLERVELFDTVTVEFPEMKVSSKAKVSKTVYDVLSGRYSSITVGSTRASISDTIIDQDDFIVQEVGSAKSELRKAVERATNWIVNGKGYMVAVKDEAGNWKEICSLDTPNIDTAVNVWRWNNGGFGFSSHGYNGPYETAITQGGEIVADFITTGTLTASLIRAGVLQSLDGETFYLDLEAGILRMNANEVTIKGKTVGDIAQGKIDNLGQIDIYNKLTKYGKAKGIYLEGETLCINASYLLTGIISDETGTNVWNLDEGTLVTKDITAYGSFRCGPPTGGTYTILNLDGQLKGYKDWTAIGYIDYSAKSWFIDEQRYVYGLQLQAEGIVRISSPLISTAATSDTSVTTINGHTTTISQHLISSISNNGNGTISWRSGTFELEFINGLCVGYTTVNS